MKLHVEDRGSGEPVVIVGGCPVSIEHMRPLGERLSRRWRSLLVHLPGYGESPAPSPYDLERCHELVEDALLGLGVAEASFVGFSAGAYRSFAIASRGRIRARAIVSLAGFGRYEPAEREAVRGLEKMLAQGLDLEPLVAQMMLSERGRLRPELVADVRGWAKATSIDNLRGEALALAGAPDLLPRIAELDVPILLRVGAADASLAEAGSSVERSRRIAAVAERPVLEEVPDVGHAILGEDFEATALSIERHLERAT
jgi:pimeloyl-ACP methyl ester carboxylesterase